MRSKSELSPEKVDALKHPTTEKAMRFWPSYIAEDPAKPDAPLAGLHKARLVWKGSSIRMRVESEQWLIAHGYRLDNPFTKKRRLR